MCVKQTNKLHRRQNHALLFSCQKPFKFSLFYKGYVKFVCTWCSNALSGAGCRFCCAYYYTIISEFWLLIRHLICLDGKEANIEFQFLAARFTFNKSIRLLSIISVRGMIKLNQLCPQCSKAFQLFWANWPKETSDKVRQI